MRWVRLGLIGTVVALGGAAGVGGWIWVRDRPDRLLVEARTAFENRDWPRAYAAWHAWNQAEGGTAATLMLEAQLADDLNQGRAAAELAERVTQLDPSATDAWTRRLNRLRVLDRPAEARRLGLAALGRLPSSAARRKVLRAATLATLAEVPDADARGQLDRWILADPLDLDARAARFGRIAANPHPGDPDRATRITQLSRIVAQHPDAPAPREALTVALADAGEVERGRAVLAAWPEASRDDRYDRLQARWDLEYNHQPDRAAEGFRRALGATPHDWKLHYGLARALRTLNQPDRAQAEALAVARLRERLDPTPLGSRLAADFSRIDEGTPAEVSTALTDLATLCRNVGLTDLAAAWDHEAQPGPLTAQTGR